MGENNGSVLVRCIIALFASSGSATAQALVERGACLVNAVMVCDGRHTPRGKTGLIMEKRFSGGSQVWDTPAYTVRGTNITPDRETGIGAWSDDEIKRSLTEGIHRLGRPLAPQMPFASYKILTPRDLDALVAWIRIIPPIE